MVTNGKLNRLPSFIGITFLTSLSSFQVLLDGTDLLLRFVHEIDAIIPSLSGFDPIQRGSTLSTVQGFKWSHLDTLLITVVIRELS